MRKLSLLSVCFAMVLLVGCAGTPYVPGARVEGDQVIFEATGKSTVADDTPLARVQAESAAATIARANLLELIKGTELSTNITVADQMYGNSEAKAAVSGWLSRAQVTVQESRGRLTPGETVTAVATLRMNRKELEKLLPESPTYVE